jgi:hypothetical protein
VGAVLVGCLPRAQCAGSVPAAGLHSTRGAHASSHKRALPPAALVRHDPALFAAQLPARGVELQSANLGAAARAGVSLWWLRELRGVEQPQERGHHTGSGRYVQPRIMCSKYGHLSEYSTDELPRKSVPRRYASAWGRPAARTARCISRKTSSNGGRSFI